VKEPAFDYLRTKEQLGYIVMCLQDDHRGVLGLSILVQSNVKNNYELQKYVSKFINEVLKETISTFDEKAFEEYKHSLLNTKIQKDKSLSAEATRFWAEVVKHSYEFTRKEQEIELIPTITLQEFKEYLPYNLDFSANCSTTVPASSKSTRSRNPQLSEQAS
jgi:secreted Zn-dependent insulinase-like peptidase